MKFIRDFMLVIFIIRRRGNPFKSRAHPVLVATSLSVMLIGAVLPFTPLGTYFGFLGKSRGCGLPYRVRRRQVENGR